MGILIFREQFENFKFTTIFESFVHFCSLTFQENALQKRLDLCQNSLVDMQENLVQFHSFSEKTKHGVGLAKTYNTACTQFERRDIARSFEKLVRR